MKYTTLKGRLKAIEGEVTVKVDVINYIDDNICYVVCPALDIIGYGYNEADARRSFDVTLSEYIKYTTNKKTLWKDLKDMGWQQAGKNKYRFLNGKDVGLRG